MSFIAYTCWDRADALRLLTTEATEDPDPHSFLATHHPIRGFDIAGSKAALVEERSEQGLLSALTHPDSRHVFCVVEGEPGSGKSHLIRWLHVKWPESGGRDLVLLIQRADGSLEGTLHHFRDRLPERYREIFDGLGPSRHVSEEGRRSDFLTKLGNSMGKAYFDRPPEDAEWCERMELSRVLNHVRVRELWGAPRRILQIIGGKGSSGASRDQELARFKVDDVLQISQMSRELRDLPTTALRFLRDLKSETDRFQSMRASSPGVSVSSDVERSFPLIFGFLSALDRRLNNAIQELLGSSAKHLDELFKKLRRQLKTEDRRLVLLLEDVTNFQGVDEKLIDALVFNADTRDDNAYCDLISVLGVTPDYFRRYIETKSNYHQRITHHVTLKAPEEGDTAGGFAVSFAARYLKAIRAGRGHLDRFDGAGEIFNRCSDGNGCKYRERCHKTFGAHDGVGLYPFTSRAISQMFSNLQDTSSAMLQTPRGLIQNILNPTMHSPDAIAQGRYPHPELEVKPLQRRTLDGALRAAIDQQDPAHRDSLRRLISWWGEPSRVERGGSHDDQGNLLYQGVPRGVFEAFELPWMGTDDASDIVRPEPDPGPSSGPEPAKRPADAEDRPKPLPRTPPSGASASPRTNWELSPSKLERHRDQLARWWESPAKLEEGDSFWNAWVHRLMVQELPWRRLGISPWLQATLFTQPRVMIEGTKQSRDNFVVPKTVWLRDGLEALITLQTRPLPDTDLEYHKYRLVRLVRKLRAEVSRHVEDSLARGPGRVWTPLALFVQLAWARAWLRGTLRPELPAIEQWAYLFSPEPEAVSAPKRRVESWDKLSDRTRTLPGELEKRLCHMVNLPQGLVNPGTNGECTLGMADPSDAIEALRSLQKSLQFSGFPASGSVKFDAFLTTALRMMEDMSEFDQIPRREGRRLIESAVELEQACPGESIQQFATNVQAAIEDLVKIEPGSPNDPVQKWTRCYVAATQGGFLAAGDGKRVDRLDDFKAEAAGMKLEDFGSQSVLFDWCIRQPADDVFVARDLVRQAADSLDRVVAHAEGVLKEAEAAGGATLKEIHDAGAALEASCTSLLVATREAR